MVDVLKSLGFDMSLPTPALRFAASNRSTTAATRRRPAHLLPRGIVGRDGAWLRQDRGQADDGHGPWTVGLHALMAAQRLRRPRPRYIVIGNILMRSSAGATSSGPTRCRTRPAWCVTTSRDDTPASLTHFAESSVRAYRTAMTPPGACRSSHMTMQEEARREERPRLWVPRPSGPPAGRRRRRR